MTGFIDGKYSRWHCQEPTETDERCLNPATLRDFRNDNVPLCDDHWRILQNIKVQVEAEERP